MREIKFRAWDKEKQCWVYVGYSIKEIAANGYELDGRDIEWVQFTGLRDKNGKEIYEGDIVEGGISPTGRHRAKGQVVWQKASWMVHLRNSMRHVDTVAPYVAVIGNIYENPELLAKSDV